MARGNQALAAFRKRLTTLPLDVAERVAREAAPTTTTLARRDYDSGRTAYGAARPQSVEGRPLSLEQTGDTRAGVRFVALGTVVRCKLGTPYAKYLIGRYDILPNGPIPAEWSRQLTELAGEAFRDEVKR